MSTIDENLISEFGITKKQASSGIGIFLQYAINQLKDDDLSQLQAIFPDTDDFIRQAPDLSFVESEFGITGNLAVQIDDNVWGFLALQAKSLICIGIHPDSMIEIIAEIVLYIKEKGNDQLAVKVRSLLTH